MDIEIIEAKTGKWKEASIEKAAILSDMPVKKHSWRFTWRILFKTEGAEFFKLSLKDTSSSYEGMLMLSLMNEEMIYMKNIEIAPHNLGANGMYDHVAGSLIAFACLKSFEFGKNAYKGYLSFESKTKLIPLYQEKYGAILALGQRMFIEPVVGLGLIKRYLNQNYG